MAVFDYQQQIDNLKKKIEKSSFHPYFSQYVKPSMMDEDRILLLTYAMQDVDIPKEEIDTYISAAMLAHYAMEMHENVTEHQLTSVKEKQLNVLAGDYYSGLYYRLLAGYQNIELIKVLADAIKIINEQKINIFQMDGGNYHSFMKSLKQVESILLIKFNSHFNPPSLYNQFIAEFLLFKKLIVEIGNMIIGKQSRFIKSLANCHIPNIPEAAKLETICYKYATESKRKLEDMMMSLPTLPSVLKMRVNQMNNHYNDLSSLRVEEI
ncbi:heptaprenyl diphosphate synthase component 1 [Lederbergia sp. NSJ-179]|uniref:heptaprenyl diphosphate synthase component 1 n=1 Tax=Lederbergia sp. NSJ-179 TaxID=2931402 RepID=UPI001FD62CC1|nr:heptaprenyl diphosphate synthase component 1 [Lederbergia sp. NSJ-179]MCJ7839457.1 heptaprenyl diphosphate synthase component 1 [Lederbergia sp. NSJ-179]